MILRDVDGEPVWEGTTVRMFTDRGKISLAPANLKNGYAYAYFQASADTGTARVIAEADGHRDTLSLALVPPGEMRVLSGIVSNDSTGARLSSAQIIIDDTLAAVTDDNGSFFLPTLGAGEHRLQVQARGYATDQRTILMDADQSQLVNARLLPLCNGVLHDQTIILDAALGGDETGDRFTSALTAAQANLDLAGLLGDSLRWGGAEVVLIRAQDSTLAVPARIKQINSISRGWYLKIGYRQRPSDSLLVQCTNYPGNQTGNRLAEAINAVFTRLPGTRVSLQQNISVPEVTMTNKMAVEVILACREPRIFTRDLPALFDSIVRFCRDEKQAQKRASMADQ
jgi:N-acetylmuramoyl-L-alanine amidase